MSDTRLPPAVTLVCWNAYPLFDHSVPSRIGGMETRAALFARGLTDSGRWQVHFVVNDFGQPDTVRYEGIDFHLYQPLHRRASENVNLRFAGHRLLPILRLDRRGLALLWQMPLLALFRFLPAWFYPLFWRRRRSHAVCCFGNNAISAQVIADCARLGIPTILCLAADSDLAPEYRPDDHGMNDYKTPHWMAHYALENADHVFVQTENQLRTLESRFSRRGELIRNPVQIAPEDPARWPARGERDTVLWIGRSDTFHKRPLLFLELAQRCPDLAFLMIVNKTHADVFDALQAQCPANLTIIERAPHAEISGISTAAPASSSVPRPTRAFPTLSCNARWRAFRSHRSRWTPRASSPAKGVAYSLAGVSIHWSVTSAPCGPTSSLPSTKH